MKKLSLLRSLVLIFLFTAGFQMVSDAQIRIFNFTDCDIFLKTGLNDNCDACDDFGVHFLNANGGMYQQAFNPLTCPDDVWLGIKWYTSIFGAGTVGYFYNPFYNPCGGTNVVGSCQGNPINVTWNGTPGGPVTVFLTN